MQLKWTDSRNAAFVQIKKLQSKGKEEANNWTKQLIPEIVHIKKIVAKTKEDRVGLMQLNWTDSRNTAFVGMEKIVVKNGRGGGIEQPC